MMYKLDVKVDGKEMAVMENSFTFRVGCESKLFSLLSESICRFCFCAFSSNIYQKRKFAAKNNISLTYTISIVK